MKILVIGIDGADWQLIDPLVKKGKLPFFKQVIGEGVKANLESTIPPVTAPAWVSFATGVNPGKHGVFDFLQYDKGKKEKKIVSSQSLKSKTIWQILSAHGKDSLVVNVPLTYPPQKIKGLMITGMLTPPGRTFTYPTEIEKEIRDEIGEYKIDINWRHITNEKFFLKDLAKTTIVRRRTIQYLLQNKRWEFAIVVFTGADRVQHLLWHKQEQISEYYELLDRQLSILFKSLSCPTDINVFFMSDHGFTQVEKNFNVNLFLEKEGLLKWKHEKIEINSMTWREKTYGKNKNLILLFKKIGFTKENINRILVKIRLERLRTLLEQKLPKWFQDLIPRTKKEIDWKETRAHLHSPVSQAISINLRGRETQGTVTINESKRLKKLIVSKLGTLEDQETKEKIFSKISLAEEIYWGDYLHLAPDIFFLGSDQKYSFQTIWGSNRVITSHYPPKGGHALEGIFLANGPSIKKGVELKRVSIYDLAPTILYLLGIRDLTELDGRVLKEILIE